MQKLNKVVLILAIIGISFSSVYSLDKNSLYETVKKKAKDSETVFLRFKVNPEDNIFAEIYSKKGGKYKLLLSRNTIISDGSTIWNIHHGRNVIISNYESTGELAIEEMLLTLLSDLVPVKLAELTNSDFGSSYRLKLHPDADSEFHSEIDNIDLFLDKQENIKGLMIKDTEGIHYQYIIDEIKFDLKMPDDMFKYKPKDDLEVIDFR